MNLDSIKLALLIVFVFAAVRAVFWQDSMLLAIVSGLALAYLAWKYPS